MFFVSISFALCLDSKKVFGKLITVTVICPLNSNIDFGQDLLLIDRSLIMRRANLIDRHRDMRLDVDNMSYEVLR